MSSSVPNTRSPSGGTRRAAPHFVAALLIAAVPALALAEEVVAVTTTNQLVTFESATPGTITSARAVTGLQAGETILAIDVRPSTGQVFALGSTGRLYRVDRATGVATQVGVGTFDVALSGTEFGMDLHPVTERIHVVSNTGQNLRIDATTGAVVDGDGGTGGTQPDAPLAYEAGDSGDGVAPDVVGAAFDDNTPAAVSTTLYVIDAGRDVLAIQGDVDGSPQPPQSGVLTTVGALGVDASEVVGFDVSGDTASAFAAMQLAAESQSRFYTVNIATGAVTEVGVVGDGHLLSGMTVTRAGAIVPPTDDMVGLVDANTLVFFNAATAATIDRTLAVTGLAVGDVLVAIDVRPETGVLYGVGRSGRLYAIDSTSGEAFLAGGPFAPALAGTEFGLDVTPVADVARIVSDADQNLRVNLVTGAVIAADTPLAYVIGDANDGQNPSVVAIAYDRNDDAASATTLFGIDAATDDVVRIGSLNGTPASPNEGWLTTMGELGVDVTLVAGFEIVGDDTAIAALQLVGGASGLYVIDLSTGRATPLGGIGAAAALRGLSQAPTDDPEVLPGLVVRKLLLKFNFKKSGKDSIRLQALVDSADDELTGSTVVVDVGGFSRTFVVAARGVTRNGDDTLQWKRERDGRVRIDVQLKKEDLADDFADEGMDGTVAAKKESRDVVVTISIDGTVFRTTVAARYTAKVGKSGIAKKQP